MFAILISIVAVWLDVFFNWPISLVCDWLKADGVGELEKCYYSKSAMINAPKPLMAITVSNDEIWFLDKFIQRCSFLFFMIFMGLLAALNHWKRAQRWRLWSNVFLETVPASRFQGVCYNSLPHLIWKRSQTSVPLWGSSDFHSFILWLLLAEMFLISQNYVAEMSSLASSWPHTGRLCYLNL